MGLDMKVVEISHENYDSLRSFINSLGDEQNSFRYFKTRGQEVLDKHLFTCLVFEKGAAAGYGHLDKEDGVVWLGIVVKLGYQGLGLGKKIMQVLLDRGKAMNVGAIQLSVDNDNEKAMALYEKYGFEVTSHKKSYAILRKRIGEEEKFDTPGVSTLAFTGQSREGIVSIAKENGWMIEFSSSFPHQDDMEEFFINADIKRLAHNYFPAPANPFVLNLASSNDTIREQSIKHCIRGLELAQKSEGLCFSAHAGFCIDPDPMQLGKKLDVNVPIERGKNWEIFIASVKTIVDKAERLGLSFYIENNVTAHFNLRNDGQEVLFCSRAEEMIRLCEEINSDNFGLLLDTAHLKVSSLALEFDIVQAVKKIKPHVKYVHHSDNDGKKDTNDSISAEYWFLPWLKEFKKSIHILEVKNIDEGQIKEQLALLKAI